MSFQNPGCRQAVADALKVLRLASCSTLLPYKVDLEIINTRTTQRPCAARNLVLGILEDFESTAQRLAKASTLDVVSLHNSALSNDSVPKRRSITCKQMLQKGLRQQSLADGVVRWLRASHGRDLTNELMMLSAEKADEIVVDFLKDSNYPPYLWASNKKDLKEGIKLFYCEKFAGYGIVAILIHCYPLLLDLSYDELGELLYLMRSSESISGLARQHETWFERCQRVYTSQSLTIVLVAAYSRI